MSETDLTSDELEIANTLLKDLLDGRDRLLTAGEVAELLNINVNTLFLWRQSGVVDLPYQRFISPGQTRGVIRYKYSDVVLFLARATKRGAEEADEHDGPEPEPGEAPAPTKRKSTRRKTKLKDQLRDLPLEEILAHTQEGTNLTVEQHRAQRAAELAPPVDAELVDNPGAIIYDAPAEEAETPIPVPTLAQEDPEAAAAAWLARFSQAMQAPAPPDPEPKEDA